MAFDAGTILAKMALDISQWEMSARAINESQQKMASQTKKTGTAFKGMWKQVAVGMGVTSLISKGIREIGRQIGDTIQKGREFEKEWANVTTMLDISKSATQKMKHELRMLSPTLGDTTDLAKGMYQVLSASIEPAKAIEFLGKAAISAKAGVTDTKTAVDALTTVINAYGMEAENVTEVSDIMFQTVKRGKTTYEELATSLGTVVPIAATTGVNFKEIAAAVATMTRMGIPASKSTMQLRQVLMSILTPTAEGIVLAEKLGIEFGANALKTKGLAGWLKELREKTKGNVDQMKVFIPNARALTAVMALAGIRAEEYTEDLEGMEEVLGNTDEAFRKQMETVDFWIETFEVAADKIKIALYEGLTAQLRESITSAEDFDKKVTQATNNAANAVSLHVGAIVEEFTWYVKVLKKAEKLFPLQAIIKELIVGKEKTSELAEAEKILTEALARAGREVVVKTEAIKPLSEEIKTLAEETLTAAERTAMLNRAAEAFGLFRWDSQLEQMRQLAEATGDIAGESILLEGQWESSMSNMEEDTLNFMASIIPGMGFMTKSVTGDIEGAGESVKGTLEGAAMEAGAILSSMGQHSKALAYAGAVINTAMGVTQALKTYPPPLSFIMAALQTAAGLVQIKAIKAQSIPSAEKGAYLPSPAIIEAGHGPMGEVILPLDRAPIGGMGAKVDFNFYAPIISTTGIASADLDRVSEELFSRMEREARRRGYSLNGS